MYVRVALIGAKYWKQLISILILILGLIFILFFASQQEEQMEYEYLEGGEAAVSPLVLRYEPLVTKYAQKYGVESYVQLLLAKIQQESGGRLPDVMQSSESIGLPPNTITDPEQSIDVGVRYFAQVLKEAKGDVKLTLQAYNFGTGFIDYALDRGGYSKEVAVKFSEMMASKLGWSRYGDVNYVDNVLRYLYGSGAGTVNARGFSMPISGSSVNSKFGVRIDPIDGSLSYHNGVDFSCKKGQPIYSVKPGTVTRAGWENSNDHTQGFGQRVYVDHGGNQVTVYAHLSKILVAEGQKVTQGQAVGGCGTTGYSTGNHLHLELHVSGRRIDPLPYIR
jgi:murein DD-endopeptidase MepM/ murein hydrolase activator NlpD